MLYQLPNGKVIEISTEQYVEMSDEELEYLIAYNYGDIMEDPWFGSVISKHSSFQEDSSTVLPDLTQTPDDEKLENLDVDDNIYEE